AGQLRDLVGADLLDDTGIEVDKFQTRGLELGTDGIDQVRTLDGKRRAARLDGAGRNDNRQPAVSPDRAKIADEGIKNRPAFRWHAVDPQRDMRVELAGGTGRRGVVSLFQIRPNGKSAQPSAKRPKVPAVQPIVKDADHLRVV